MVSSNVLSSREASSVPFTETCRTDQTSRQPEPKRVIIPDLFVSFISQRPSTNPYYEVMKKDSEAWMKQYETITTLPCLSLHFQIAADVSDRVCHWTEEEYTKHVRGDFPYLAAVMAPEAGPDELRTICDWYNWVGL